MLRAVAYTFGAIILISLLRGSIGFLVKTFQDLTNPKPVLPTKCPNCGTLVHHSK